MPRIPIDEGKGLIEQNVPGADISSRGYGGEGQALQDIGASMFRMGSDFAAKIKESDDRNAANQRLMEDDIDRGKFENDLRLKTPADGSGYAGNMRNYLQKRFKDGQNNMPSESARQRYVEAVKGDFSNALVKAQNYEFKARQDFKLENNIKLRNESASRFAVAPDHNEAVAAADKWESGVRQGVGIDYEEGLADELIKEGRNYFARQNFNGYDATEDYDTGLAVLRSKSADGRIAKDLKPEEASAYMKAFQKGRKRKMEKELHDISYKMNQLEYTAASGKSIDVGDVNLMVNRLKNMPDDVIPPQEKNDRIDTLRFLPRFQYQVSQLNKQPLTELGKITSGVPGVDKSGTNARDRLHYEKLFEQQKAQIVESVKKDAMADGIQNNPALATSYARMRTGDEKATIKFVNEMDNYYNTRKVPQEWRRVFTKSDSMVMGETLINNKEPLEGVRQLDKMQRSFGPAFERAFTDLVKDNSNVAPYAVAAYADSPSAKLQIFKNLSGAEDINTLYKSNSEKWSDVDINSQIMSNPSVNDIRQSLIDSGGTGSANLAIEKALVEQVRLEAKRISVSGTANIAKNVDQAVKNVLGEAKFVDVGNDKKIWLKSETNGVQNNYTAIQNFFDGFNNRMKSQKIDVQQTNDKGTIGFKNVPKFDAFEQMKLWIPIDKNGNRVDKVEYFEYLRDNGRWISNENNDGAYFSKKIGDVWVKVLREDNSAVEVKFSDLSMDRPTIGVGK